MTLNFWHIAFQILIYLGTAITIYGAIKKNNWEYIGLATILTATISYNIISTVIENIDKEKIEKLTLERDNAIKNAEDNTDKLLNMSAFFSDASNRITNFYLILDLGSTPISETFEDFALYLHFVEDDITLKFESFNPKEPPVENVWYVQSSAVKGSDFNNNPVISYGTQNFKNRSEIIFDLSFASRILPDRLSMKDLMGTFYNIVVTSKHKDLIKEFKLNANNWNFVNKSCNKDTWKDFGNSWIDSKSELSILYNRYEFKHYDAHRIDPVRNSVHRYEIIRSNYEDASKGTVNDAVALLSKVDNLQGNFRLGIDNRWLLKERSRIDYFPKTEVENFKLHIYKDFDNKLKVNIGNSVIADVTLEYLNDKLFEYEQKIHGLRITWDKDVFCLYINGKLVADNKK